MTQLKASYHDAAQDKGIGQQIEVGCNCLTYLCWACLQDAGISSIAGHRLTSLGHSSAHVLSLIVLAGLAAQ